MNQKKMKQVKKETAGITLIALVITIIILIILAGVSINALIGENGLIGRAKLAKEQYTNATIDEQEKLNELEAQLAMGQKPGLPEITTDTEVGVQVKLPDKWATETGRYISTSTGLEVTSATKVATVYAVSIGGGECVPVPYGFYYVGGNLDTGVIISDEEADKYDGTTDKTTYAYTTSLTGNQFVWIPCTTNSSDKSKTLYTKTSWGKQNAEWDTTTPKAEVQQIEKYGGFYVGRYEAGLASDMSEFTSTQQHTGSNQIYNLYKTPQSKAGLAPWNFVDWTHSKANAESMYNNNYVSSGLITGTQWDVILNTLKSKASLSDSDMTNSQYWGNYKNTAIAYTGRKATAYYSSSSWYLPVFGSTETSTTKDDVTSNENKVDLLTTGASATTEKYHIYDIAGNLWEWTEEDSHYATSGQYRVLRGGSYLGASSVYPACYRGYDSVSITNLNLGFRAVLYIK